MVLRMVVMAVVLVVLAAADAVGKTKFSAIKNTPPNELAVSNIT